MCYPMSMNKLNKKWFRIIDLTTGQNVFAVEASSIRGAILMFRKRCVTEHHYPWVSAIETK